MKSVDDILYKAAASLLVYSRCLYETYLVPVDLDHIEREKERLEMVQFGKDIGFFDYMSDKQLKIMNTPITEKPDMELHYEYRVSHSVLTAMWALGSRSKFSLLSNDAGKYTQLFKGFDLERIKKEITIKMRSEKILRRQYDFLRIHQFRVELFKKKPKKANVKDTIINEFGEELVKHTKVTFNDKGDLITDKDSGYVGSRLNHKDFYKLLSQSINNSMEMLEYILEIKPVERKKKTLIDKLLKR